MNTLEEILLLSGNDIPFFEAKINVHQPTLREISLIGEENFFIACQFLNFSKDVLSEEDRNNLADIDDFEVLMSIVNGKDSSAQALVQIAMLLSLLFPDYDATIEEDGIHLDNETDSTIIDKENYVAFRDIFRQMFALQKSTAEEFNPKSEAAKKIAEKLKKGREKVARAKGVISDKKIAVFSRYVSILAIGLQIDINTLLNHTVFQITDMFKRFQKYQSFDINLKARMAGAIDLDEVDNWMDDLYS